MNCTVYCIDIQNINLHNIFFSRAHYVSSFTPLIPNQCPMKKIYVILLMGFSFLAFGQDSIDLRNLKNEEISGFKLYPNPATADMVYVTTEKNDTKEIRIYDVFGELVLTDRISNKTLDISRLSPGVYVIQVTENKKSINRKLVVK